MITPPPPAASRFTPADVAGLCRAHWGTLGRCTGVLLANGPPEGCGLDQDEMQRIVAETDAEATRRGIGGPERTPYLLAQVAAPVRSVAPPLAQNLPGLSPRARGEEDGCRRPGQRTHQERKDDARRAAVTIIVSHDCTSPVVVEPQA